MESPEESAELDLAPGGSTDAAAFPDLVAPRPTNPTPPLSARLIAFAGVLLGGLLGALIGFGVADLFSGGSSTWSALGALVGAIGCAVGLGIIVSLTLRSMNEWKSVKHPEASAHG